MFETLEDHDLYVIVYDKQTRVEYCLTKIVSGAYSGPYGFSSITMLVNADGSPKLYIQKNK